MDFRKVGGQEEDQKLLGEGQSRKNETKLGGRAGKWPKWSHKTESVGQTVWRPYAMRLMMMIIHLILKLPQILLFFCLNVIGLRRLV